MIEVYWDVALSYASRPAFSSAIRMNTPPRKHYRTYRHLRFVFPLLPLAFLRGDKCLYVAPLETPEIANFKSAKLTSFSKFRDSTCTNLQKLSNFLRI